MLLRLSLSFGIISVYNYAEVESTLLSARQRRPYDQATGGMFSGGGRLSFLALQEVCSFWLEWREMIAVRGFNSLLAF